MIGWTISLVLLLTWWRGYNAGIEMLVASGLFAIAGSIGGGMNTISAKFGKIAEVMGMKLK